MTGGGRRRSDGGGVGGHGRLSRRRPSGVGDKDLVTDDHGDLEQHERQGRDQRQAEGELDGRLPVLVGPGPHVTSRAW